MRVPRATVLMVCTANICRSPLMEIALRSMTDDTQFEIGSAGVRGWNAKPIDSMVRLEMARLDLDPEGFLSRPLTERHLEGADLVLTATREHRGAVLAMEPQALRRTFTLREFDGLTQGVSAESLEELCADAARRRGSAPADQDVPDPFGRAPKVHREVADLIVETVTSIAKTLDALPTRNTGR